MINDINIRIVEMKTGNSSGMKILSKIAAAIGVQQLIPTANSTGMQSTETNREIQANNLKIAAKRQYFSYFHGKIIFDNPAFEPARLLVVKYCIAKTYTTYSIDTIKSTYSIEIPIKYFVNMA